jgi:hypothetical protein
LFRLNGILRTNLPMGPTTTLFFKELVTVGAHHSNRRISLAENASPKRLEGFPALSPTRPRHARIVAMMM